MQTRITASLSAVLLGAFISSGAAAQTRAPADLVPVKPPPVPNLAPRGAAPAPAAAPAAPAQGGNQAKQLGDEMECLLEPHLVAHVGAAVEGTLSEVLVDRGAVVRRGQVVARLNSSVESATVNLRRAQEEYGLRKMARNEELFKKELISASEKDELETQTRIAALERKQQQEVLNLRTITSPLNGVVVERYLSPGDRVAQEKIMKLAQIDPLNVEVIAPVGLFGRIRPGMAGEVRVAAMGGSYKARVTVVDRVIDAASGTFGVRLELPNPGNRLPAGLKCNVRFAG
ncbi:MAG TPA: efflux RND transporter periplasmic adaptor subunit [Noviherbaspirillum sp.]|uniref:efflux RND transporter periplasmic adaptor subunit n=1 Tax=Noviherbaspirillum sp. TaxID=1926288 RepID=UPI002F92D28D